MTPSSSPQSAGRSPAPSDSEKQPSDSSPHSSLDEQSTSRTPPPPCPLTHTLLALLPFSLLGTLTRLSLSLLFTRRTSPIPALFYAQFLGCFLFGFFQVSGVVRKGTPGYVAATTGYCGCLTSFSAAVVEGWEECGYAGTEGRGMGEGVLGVVGYFFGTMCVAFAGLYFGQGLGRGVSWSVPRVWIRRVERWMPVLAVLAFLAPVIVVAAARPARTSDFGFALIFTAPGMYTRYTLSLLLNPLSRSFYWGTFTANILGTAILCAIIIGQLRLAPHHDSMEGGYASTWHRATLSGLAAGFCGSMTTVSTWAGEVDSLKGRGRAVYAVGSWVVGFGVVCVVLGGYVWSR